MTKYNGHRSWNAWNVSLWVNNDEWLYRQARYYARKFGIAKGAEIFAQLYQGQKTPDGAVYNKTSVREAFRGIL